VEGGVLRRYAVLGERAVVGHHDVESGDSVPLFELGHVLADLVDETGDIVPGVEVLALPRRDCNVIV
jgi:hypothetical protein